MMKCGFMDSAEAALSTVDSGLMVATGVTADPGSSGSWLFSPSNPNYAADGNDSTYAQFTGLSLSFTTWGSILLTFPTINASEILAVRFRCKGKGGSGGSNNHTVSIRTAADSTASPLGIVTLASFINGGADVTVDSGLSASDYFLSNSNVYVDFDGSGLCGTSSAVLNYWAGGARLLISMSDYNGGGTGGKNYSPMLQVTYTPA